MPPPAAAFGGGWDFESERQKGEGEDEPSRREGEDSAAGRVFRVVESGRGQDSEGEGEGSPRKT
jgi:hypothetical protein